MKKLLTVLLVLFINSTLIGQAPEKMSYQAVIRDAANNIVQNSQVGMQISIIQSNTSGVSVFIETHIPNTNSNGLISIELGEGTLIEGNFAAIDWSDGPYFIKTEIDPTGNNSYSIEGISQLISVPYALHAKTAENLTSNNKTASILHTRAFMSEKNAMLYSINGQEEKNNEAFVQIPVTRSGTLKNMFIYPAGFNPKNGTSVTATLRINKTDTELSVTHTGADGINVIGNTIDEVIVNQGELISIKFQETNGVRPGGVYRLTYELQ